MIIVGLPGFTQNSGAYRNSRGNLAVYFSAFIKNLHRVEWNDFYYFQDDFFPRV